MSKKRNEGNRGTEIMRGNRTLEEDTRSPQKVSRVYLDEKLNRMVTVLEGPKDVPYRCVPVGWVE